MSNRANWRRDESREFTYRRRKKHHEQGVRLFYKRLFGRRLRREAKIALFNNSPLMPIARSVISNMIAWY